MASRSAAAQHITLPPNPAIRPRPHLHTEHLPGGGVVAGVASASRDGVARGDNLGATGLVGKSILQGLLNDPDVVYALGRRTPPVAHPKLDARAVDFLALPTLPEPTRVYLALETTIKQAGCQAAFRAVDYEANLEVARPALASGAKRAGQVSATSANAKSRIFYCRVKGELEAELARLHFTRLSIARPSLLVGSREDLKQPARPGEQWSVRLNPVLGCLILKGRVCGVDQLR